MADFIAYNTERRKQATNDAEKDFWKLIIVCMYGKSIENVRKRLNIKFCTSLEKAQKFTSKHTYKNFTIFSENLLAIHQHRVKITLNKPLAIGMAVLDLSKNFMYQFHYNIIRPNFPDIQLLYMDTDSLFYANHNGDFYEFMKTHLDYFDTSDYPHPTLEEPNIPLHPLYSTKNKKEIGKFKDELNSVKITKFVGLRSKTYAFTTETGGCDKRMKGIKKNVRKNQISIEDFETCLFENQIITRDQTIIRSKKHKMQTITQNKKALTSNDTKRIIREDGISTYAHGHKNTL
jgi:hypothetical protein